MAAGDDVLQNLVICLPTPNLVLVGRKESATARIPPTNNLRFKANNGSFE